MAKKSKLPRSKKDVKQDVEYVKSFFDEFKEFILRGNVIELTIGLTVGTAFTKVINSLVNNLIMPIVGLLLSGDSFKDLFFSMDGKQYENLQAAELAKAPILKYGMLISDIVDFLTIALVIFLMVKFITKLRRKEKIEAKDSEAKVVTTKKTANATKK